MWFTTISRIRLFIRNVRPLRSDDILGGCSRYYGVRISVEDGMEDSRSCYPGSSLAKSLACLPDEPLLTDDNHNRKNSMDSKRWIELRIKKMVKAQYVHEKFCDLMNMVIAKPGTLSDCYDLVRLNSHVEQSSRKDDLCFSTIAEELVKGEFSVKENSVTMYGKNEKSSNLVLPKLKLRVIQEAVRIVLEVVYRPQFLKISHCCCRSGRGQYSALRYVQKEIGKSDWWFTISMRKVCDNNVQSKLISIMEEKIQDAKLFQFINQMFDVGVVNLVFGVYPKGNGLPQEGVLSPILMNIYLDMFDSEAIRLSMRYEALGIGSEHSNLRGWFRRQIKNGSGSEGKSKISGGNKLKVCRCMDEIVVLVSGSRDVAMDVKFDMLNFLRNSLHIDVDNQMDPVCVNHKTQIVQFVGTAIVVRASRGTTEALRAVHKLKDKVQMFVSQRQKIWDCFTVRIGKKWLAWGLRRLKESEIKQLGLSTPLLDHLSQFRKPGMKTDHWFKSLLKTWMQDMDANCAVDEEALLSKCIVEPALPRDMRESFDNFTKQAEEYVSSESAATLALLKSSLAEHRFDKLSNEKVVLLEAPTDYIKRSLLHYGVVGFRGYPKHISALCLHDDELIICWFSGLSQRWMQWYSEYENFAYIKLLIAQCVRKSCTRTLGAKHQVSEELIEKRYDSELSGIPMTDELLDEISSHSGDSLYGTYSNYNSGLCLLSLSRVKVTDRMLNCFVMGCTASSPSMYSLHVKEYQKFPGWRTGFSSSVHPSLNRRRIGLCRHHVKALYLGKISLQAIEFGALNR